MCLSRARTECWHVHSGTTRLHLRDDLGYSSNCWGLEKATQGQFYLERFAEVSDDLSSQERMPTPIEEVVVDADSLKMEYLRPDAAQHLLSGGPGCYIVLGLLELHRIGCGQSTAV